LLINNDTGYKTVQLSQNLIPGKPHAVIEEQLMPWIIGSPPSFAPKKKRENWSFEVFDWDEIVC
jgi:hypothetical protein